MTSTSGFLVDPDSVPNTWIKAHPSGAEMLLWVKTVGASDGLCGIAPTTPAGTFDPGLAMHLIAGS